MSDAKEDAKEDRAWSDALAAKVAAMELCPVCDHELDESTPGGGPRCVNPKCPVTTVTIEVA